nr:unnamed protein product [Callosobruchus chinensis]
MVRSVGILWFERWDKRRPLSLADLLNKIKTTKNIQVIPGNIVIFPPDNVNGPVTDEDSSEEENVVMYNLPGSQLRAECEFNSDDEKPLSNFVKRKPKKIKKFSFSKRDLQSNLQTCIPVRTVKNQQSPASLFTSVFDKAIIDMIVSYSNLYAQQTAPKDAREYFCYDRLDHLVVYDGQQRRCAVCHKKASYINLSKRPLSQTELEQLAEHFGEGFSSDEEPFPASDSEYVCSSSDESEDGIGGKKQKKQLGTWHQHNEIMDSGTSEHQQGGSSEAEVGNLSVEVDTWNLVDNSFCPRFGVPPGKDGNILLRNISRSSTELDIFLKLFPRSLFMVIAEHTNERLLVLENEKHEKEEPTDVGEMMIVVGCMLVMSYNIVPGIRHNWSTNKSLGNEAIKNAISRNRFQLLLF